MQKEGRDILLLVFLLAVPLAPLLFTVLRLDFIAYNNSSDTFLYLDIARNLIQGRGLVVSFNNYLFWTGTYYPALPFVHCAWPLLLSILWPVLSTLKSLVLCNFVLAIFNAGLVYRLAFRLMKDKPLAYVSALIFVASVSFQMTLLRLLTEQLSLLVTLLALWIWTTGPLNLRRASAAGLCLAAGFLICSSGFFYPLGFAAGLFFSAEDKTDKLRLAAVFLAASLGFMALWETVIHSAYGVFYPQYPAAFQNFYLSAFYHGGRLSLSIPALRPQAVSAPVSFLGTNVLGVLRALFAMLQLLLIFSLAGTVRILRKERSKLGLTLVLLAFVQIFSMVCFYPYIKLNDAELVRFLMLPVLAFLIIGLKEFKAFCFWFFRGRGKIFFVAIILIVFWANMRQSLEVLDYYWAESRTEKARVFKGIAAWVQENTKSGELIAAEEFVFGSVYLERPVVSFLQLKLLDENNLQKFKSIYHPRIIIVEKSAWKDRLLRQAGYCPVLVKKGDFISPFAIYEAS